MKNATFYLLDQHTVSDGLTAVERLACSVGGVKWREGKRVLVACEDDAQASRLDEALWARVPDAFVPHNLAGEGPPRSGAPVEIFCSHRRGNEPWDVLISVLSIYAEFVSSFHEVIDFVPDEDVLKQLARDRYKTYRSVGFQLTMATSTGY